MAKISSNLAVQSLLGDAADAMSNMYEVYIKFPGQDSGQVMTVRAEGFDIPEAEVGTYEISYHGHKISKPKTELTFDRKFSLTFRMDAGYNWHQTFLNWQSMVGNPVTGGVANVAAALGEVTVVALKDAYIAMEGVDNSFFNHIQTEESSGGGDLSQGTIKEGDDKNQKWVFKQVWVKKVGQPKFKTEGADKMTFAVDFCFGQCEMPGYNPVEK